MLTTSLRRRYCVISTRSGPENRFLGKKSSFLFLLSRKLPWREATLDLDKLIALRGRLIYRSRCIKRLQQHYVGIASSHWAVSSLFPLFPIHFNHTALITVSFTVIPHCANVSLSSLFFITHSRFHKSFPPSTAGKPTKPSRTIDFIQIYDVHQLTFLNAFWCYCLVLCGRPS